MKYTLLVSCLALASFIGGAVSTADARSVVRVDEAVSLANDQVVTGDFYGVAGHAALSGEVTGDASLLGRRAILDGKVASDTLAVALAVDVHGEVGDDLRIVAGEATVASHIKGDLVVVAGRLKVLSDAKIDGDIIFFGQEAEIAGEVGNDIMGTMSDLRIDAAVGGDVDVTTYALTLGDRTVVDGTVQYVSSAEMTRATNAVVSGEVVRNQSTHEHTENPLRSLMSIVLPLVFAALTWYLFLRNSLEQLVRHATTNYLRVGLIGAVVLLLVPLVGMLLLVSGLGTLLGVIVLVCYIFLLCVAMVAIPALLGGFVKLWLAPTRPFNALWVLVGAAMASVLLLVPYGGMFLLFAALILSLGALADRLYRSVR